MATYVLVHGGGHGGWCYQRVARLLRASGHEVYTPSLSGMAEHTHRLAPDIDLDTQITDIVNLLHYEDLRDVILAGHSYGGLVITGAVDRAVDRVGKLVYLDSVAPADGQSLAMIAGPLMEEARASAKVVNGVELVLFPDSSSVRHYGVTNPDDLAWMAERLTPHPWKCFEQPIRLTNQDAIARVPTYNVICTSRFEMPGNAGASAEIIEQLRAMPNTWLLDAGHDLMITEPKATADILMEIARS